MAAHVALQGVDPDKHRDLWEVTQEEKTAMVEIWKRRSDSDTAEESTRGHESDTDGHDNLGNRSGVIASEAETQDEIGASCNRSGHQGPPESKRLEHGGKCGLTGSSKMVEIVANSVSVNEIAGANKDVHDDANIWVSPTALGGATPTNSATANVAVEAQIETRAIEGQLLQDAQVSSFGRKRKIWNMAEISACLCGQSAAPRVDAGSVGSNVVCCRIPGCETKWYHLACVGLSPSSNRSWIYMCNGSDFDKASFKPPSDAKGSVTAEEPQAVESNDTFSPPPVVGTEEETEELPKVPSKPKPKPKKLREEIRIATEGLKAAQVTKASGTTTAAGDKKGLRKDGTQMVTDARDLFNDEVILVENSEQVSTRMHSDQNFITKKRKHDQTHRDAKPASEPRAPSWASHAAAQMVMSRKSGPGRSGSGSGPPPLMHTSAPSALTNNVKVISRVALPLAEVQAEPSDTGVNSDAGLSDNDEMNGNEREAAVNSPPRVDSEEPTALKKAQNEELPTWLDSKWFRQTYITTYMAYVSQATDPWDVPTKLAVETMQRIWDGSGGRNYKITASTAVYQKTVQHLADSWRNIIGSSGVAVLLTYFESDVTLRDSDTGRQGFASYHLADLRFAYKQSNIEDKKKWKGLFRNPLILQVFAAHLSAIDGSNLKEIPGLDKTPACGALGLSVASVERALKLVATCTLTIDLVNAANAKGFSDVAWGKATRNYVKSAHSLSTAKFGVIVQEAKEFMKPIRGRRASRPEVVNLDADDEQARLVDNSDSD
ncbi:hypothetical protein EDB85DRAFT_1895159 [Lactarius pseudohatsudake]|nr:hypothetical protein EDB85DRAFT_1895159 [Lactarius pseudohatsudake]